MTKSQLSLIFHLKLILLKNVITVYQRKMNIELYMLLLSGTSIPWVSLSINLIKVKFFFKIVFVLLNKVIKVNFKYCQNFHIFLLFSLLQIKSWHSNPTKATRLYFCVRQYSPNHLLRVSKQQRELWSRSQSTETISLRG